MRSAHNISDNQFINYKIKIMRSLIGLLKTGFAGLLILFCIPASFAGDHQTDSLSLVALYDSTAGDSWTNNTGWKTDTLGAWYGITLENGRVIEISLSNNNLNGPVPAQIGELDSLENLILDHNALSDSIPAEIGDLLKLVRLRLNSNNLSGTIPPQLGNLTHLGQIYLGGNNLTGTIPIELGNLTEAWDLYLSQNSLYGPIPTAIGNMSNLQLLYLDNNDLTGGIPTELADLTHLNFMNLTGNPLGGTIPPQLGTIASLIELSLGSCQLTGSIPIELTELPNLQTLNLSFNQLTDSIPSQIEDMSSLQTLNLYNNQLSGYIPPELGNLSNLTQLSLSTNNFTGSIPPEIGNLSELYYLELYGNELTGSIPPELGNLTSLWSFIISENQLTGSIPHELGNLSALTRFYAQNNRLSGAVPEELANLTNLNYIHIRNNDLEDLPDFSGLESVIQFYVENNKFSFGDLEPNIHILTLYSPQDSIGLPDTLYFTIEDTLQIETQTDGLYNNYQWNYNGASISDNNLYSGANDSVLFVRDPTIAEAGAYSCQVTNDTVIGLTLYRHPLYLQPTVKVTGLPQGVQCAGTPLEIEYKSVEVSSGNIFTAELSDSLGGFDDPVILGSITSTDSIGTIPGYIPDTIPTGNKYRVRITSSNLPLTGIPSTDTLQILNQTLPNPVITPSVDPDLCDGETVEISTETLLYLQYVWYRNDEILEGDTTNSIVVNEEGSYYVRTFNACSTDSLTSNSIDVIVNPLPEIYLSLEGTLLTATYDPDYSYTWYKDGVDLILDESTWEYTATENGEYLVEVTDENGCFGTSNSQIISGITGIDNILSNIALYPNPTNDKLYIIVHGDINIERIAVTDLSGNTIIEDEYPYWNSGDLIKIDLSVQNSGFYIANIETSEGIVYFKLMKQ